MNPDMRGLTAAVAMARTALDRREARPKPRGDTVWHEEAERRYRAGETLREIGLALHCCKDSVREALLARGVPMRDPGRRKACGTEARGIHFCGMMLKSWEKGANR
jgi:hypothetical protein